MPESWVGIYQEVYTESHSKKRSAYKYMYFLNVLLSLKLLLRPVQ